MQKYQEKLKAWYEATADRYDAKDLCQSRRQELGTFNKLLDLVEFNKKTKILEVAVGTGIFLLEALKRHGLGYGLDISPKMLMQFKKKLLKLGWQKKIKALKIGEAKKLPFDSKFFDLVICIGLFDYYPLKIIRIFLKEMKRVMKINGKLIIDFPNINNKKVYQFQKEERFVGHEVFLYPQKDLRNFVNYNGFKILKSCRAGIEIQYLLMKN